jgi:hypothetical protein
MTITPPTIPYNTPEPTTIPRCLKVLSTIQYVGAGLLLVQLPLLLWCIFCIFWYLNGHRGFPNFSMFMTLVHGSSGGFSGYIPWSIFIAALTVYSARQITRGRRRIQSVVIAGLQCILIPLGTVLGLATMITLFTVTFKRAYSQRAAASAQR